MRNDIPALPATTKKGYPANRVAFCFGAGISVENIVAQLALVLTAFQAGILPVR